jgi:hypothetical protein
MNVTLPIPNNVAARLGHAGDVSRRVLEAFAADEYRVGRLSLPELRSLLGFATHAELDGFLKARGIFEDYSQSDLDRERQTWPSSVCDRAGRRRGHRSAALSCAYW